VRLWSMSLRVKNYEEKRAITRQVFNSAVCSPCSYRTAESNCTAGEQYFTYYITIPMRAVRLGVLHKEQETARQVNNSGGSSPCSYRTPERNCTAGERFSGMFPVKLPNEREELHGR